MKPSDCSVRMSDYQSKRRYSKTSILFHDFGRRAITSQNDATPKRRCSTSSIRTRAITSQNDATPKHQRRQDQGHEERLPVKTTLLQNCITDKAVPDGERLPVKTTLLQNHVSVECDCLRERLPVKTTLLQNSR